MECKVCLSFLATCVSPFTFAAIFSIYCPAHSSMDRRRFGRPNTWVENRDSIQVDFVLEHDPEKLQTPTRPRDDKKPEATSRFDPRRCRFNREEMDDDEPAPVFLHSRRKHGCFHLHSERARGDLRFDRQGR